MLTAHGPFCCDFAPRCEEFHCTVCSNVHVAIPATGMELPPQTQNLVMPHHTQIERATYLDLVPYSPPNENGSLGTGIPMFTPIIAERKREEKYSPDAPDCV